jgi:hypothetical protein
MALVGIAFVGYGVAFPVTDAVESGLELGVGTRAGMTSADLDPTVADSIGHLHVAAAAFIVSTGVAVVGRSWVVARGAYGRT